MYNVVRTKDFEKSYGKIKHSGKLKPQVQESLREVIKLLGNQDKLPSIFKDHQLHGEMQEYRECHIKGNLLLVYQIKKEELVLVLIEIGTHSYLKL